MVDLFRASLTIKHRLLYLFHPPDNYISRKGKMRQKKFQFFEFFIILFIPMMLIFIPGGTIYPAAPFDYKKNELDELKMILIRAKIRIREARESRAGDFLKLLPTLSVSRRTPYSDIPGKETYFSASISTNQFFSIADAMDERRTVKRKALRKAESLGFKIKKLIEEKYLIKGQIWKLYMIKRSMDNPVEVAKVDEKIDGLLLKVEEKEADIENAYAEIEFACVEAER